MCELTKKNAELSLGLEPYISDYTDRSTPRQKMEIIKGFFARSNRPLPSIIISGDSEGYNDNIAPTAWAINFSSDKKSKGRPIIYDMQVMESGHMSSYVYEVGSKAIFVNSASHNPEFGRGAIKAIMPIEISSNNDFLPYDPATGYELACIVKEGIKDIFIKGKGKYYYVSNHNVANSQLPMPDKINPKDVVSGCYLFESEKSKDRVDIRLLGAGPVLQNVCEAAKRLRNNWEIGVEVWSCPSYTKLARETRESYDFLALDEECPRKKSHLQTCLGDSSTPVIAVTGYSAHIAEQIMPQLNCKFKALGTDQVTPRERGSNKISANYIVASSLSLLFSNNSLSRESFIKAINDLRPELGREV